MQIEHSEILELSPMGVVVCDSDQRISWCNNRFLEETNLKEETLLGQFFVSLPLEAIDKTTHLVQLFDDNNKLSKKFHYWSADSLHHQGATVHYFVQTNENEGKSKHLHSAKLPKRPNWIEFLDYEISRSRRYDNPLCILKLYVEVKNKPETVQESDLCQTIKDTLMDELRWADMIGNTSKGSFLMVLPETPLSALKQLEEKLAKAIDIQLKLLSKGIENKVLFGSSCWQKHDDSQKILKRARINLVDNMENNF